MLQSPPDEGPSQPATQKFPHPVKDESTPETTDVTAFHALADRPALKKLAK